MRRSPRDIGGPRHFLGAAVVTAVLRGLPWTRAAVLFGLLTLEGALGVATLQAGQPLVLSIFHQACAIAV